MTKAMLSKFGILLCATLLTQASYLLAQTASNPQSPLDQSYIPPSPNSMGFQTYGDIPVALYEGTPVINLPVYDVKCGSLSLPITMSYNFNGFFPLQDAGWVGLGWNLNAGGVITRQVESGVDESQNSGYNYDQYTIASKLFSGSALNSFLQEAYNANLGYIGTCWDLAPDIFDAEFCGHSGKFFWYQGQAYQLSYNKDLNIGWPSPTSNFTVTTSDGAAYTFGTQETTTCNYFSGSDSTQITYPSSWLLTSVVSADKQDTITLTYAPYSWAQVTASYQRSYTLSLGSQADLGSDPEFYAVSPNVQSQVLQSIQCRTTRVNFVPNSALRTDVYGSYPSLQEIDVYDNVTGNLVKKTSFGYEYFGSSGSNPITYGRLALKRFRSVNTQNPADTLTYTFSYNNEYGTFPVKSTNGIDYWGYYNGANDFQSILPPPGSRFYAQQPPSTAKFGASNREPSLNYCLYGALDTITYPAGGYTILTYEQNTYNNNSTVMTGPGVRIRSTTDVSNNPNNPEPKMRTYTYLLDDNSSSSGVLTNPPNFTGPAFVAQITNTTTTTYLYNVYRAADNASGIGGINPIFYYQKVTEIVSSGQETHRSDHYFSNYGSQFPDVRETEQIDYLNIPNTNTFTPLQKSISSYQRNTVKNFIAASAYIDSEYIVPKSDPTNRFTFGYNKTTWTAYWLFPTSQQMTTYDANGDSLVTTSQFTYNTTTHNLTSVQKNTSDGQTLMQYFKYPEDYASNLTGNMVAAGVVGPVLESQTWLQQSASQAVLIGGAITQYDQTIFKPVAQYGIETTAPISALNNQTTSGGLYTSLLSDSRYILKGQIQYDSYANPSVSTKSADMPVSYIWDYKHALPIANVKNAVNTDIGYTSFEADGTGNISLGNGGVGIVSTDALTGSKCYQIDYVLTMNNLNPSKTYIVSCWAKSGLPAYNGYNGSTQVYVPNIVWTTGKTINGWTYLEKAMTGVTTINVKGGGGLVDEVRFYPANAQMTTFTYLPSIGITSQCDVDNRVTYYQYDGLGRLQVQKDQDGNIIKTYQYHYQQ